MSRRLVLLLLVPTLLVAMVGLGLAAMRTPAAEPTEPAAAPSATPDVVIAMPPPPDPIGHLPPVQRPSAPEPPTAPTAPDGPTEPAAPAYDVAAVQRQLTEQGYYVGPLDGREGPGTRAAVMAFQKVNGLAADGTVGPLTLSALASPVTPALRGGPATRIEIDLDTQVLYYVADGRLERIIPVSSGSGQTYRTPGGGTARSLTPVGTFRVERRIRGVRNAPLGTLYDPLYFHKGWAIHGSDSVPAYPASHGCVRVPRADAIWLFDRAPVGTTVVLYGGQHTFTLGSNAAGTDNPAGDVGTDAPAPTPAPAPTQPEPPAHEPTPAPPAHEPTPAPPAHEPTPAPPTQEPTPEPTPGPTPGPTPEPTPGPDHTPPLPTEPPAP
jgi:lipoprotein-anchoring transpeptidase ErfK/SrfK